MNKILMFFLLFAFCTDALAQEKEKFTVSGFIRDAGSGEELINANLYIPTTETGVVSNLYGYYSVTLEEGNYVFIYSYLGFESQRREIQLDRNQVLDIELGTEGELLEEVVVTSEVPDENVEDVGMSKVDLEMETVKKIPALMGEVDIIKALQLLPGVTTVGEGNSGMFVRGGNFDQNLILLDEAPVYNAAHLLGFFSVFNSDAIKDVQLYKGGIPAYYGGRLSSVVDIRMKEGNSKKFSGSAGLGTISSRLTLESPIGDNGSFMVSGRRTYADIFLAFSKDTSIRDNKLYFYDLNAKANYRFGENDRVFISGYFGRDVFGATGARFDWGNQTGTVRWNHVFNQSLFSNLTVYYSNFDYFLGAEDDGVTGFAWTSRLQDLGLKADFTYFLNPNNTVKFGVQTIKHDIDPGSISFPSGDSLPDFKLGKAQGWESGIYISNEQKLGSRLKVDYGLRFSSYHDIGSRDVYTYDEEFRVADTVKYGNNELIQDYYNLEPRLGIKYTLNGSSSVKASYNRTAQYIQLASNTSSSIPLDVWFASGKNVRPQLADQVALGYFRNFDNNTIEASIEVYYKKFTDAIDFKDHAQLLLNPRIEGEVRIGEGRSYGAELLIRKNKGKLTGWIGYTLARAERKIETISGGNWYRANYDKLHDISIVANYDLTEKWGFGGTWVYGSGRPATFPTGRYQHLGRSVPVFSERNGERLPDYHRLDLAVTYIPSKKWFKVIENQLVLSIYNVYARKNAYSINFIEDQDNNNNRVAQKTYLFSIIPALTWNLKF